MEVREDRKVVEIWLTRAEEQTPAVHAALQTVYRQYGAGKYLVAVYHSGEQPLYGQTLELLRYNRRRLAERDIQAGALPQETNRGTAEPSP